MIIEQFLVEKVCLLRRLTLMDGIQLIINISIYQQVINKIRLLLYLVTFNYYSANNYFPHKIEENLQKYQNQNEFEKLFFILFKNQLQVQAKDMGSYLQAPITTKKIHFEQLNNIKYVSGQMQGWRIKMQDAVIHQLNIGDGNALFAVFDGHGGAEVSAYVANIFVQLLKETDEYKKQDYAQAMEKTFKKIDEMIDSQQGNKQLKKISKQLENQINNAGKISQNVGCTANVVLITKQKYVIANAGDSRSALCRDGKLVVFSQDHKPQDPIQFNRIKKAGGTVVNGRVNGGLNLTRAFGDFAYKQNKSLTYAQQMITCKPDIKQIPVDPLDQFIVIGCDGIWQRFVDNTFGFLNLLRSQYKINKAPQKIMQDILTMLLAKDTKTGIGCDNMSAIFITLK